jgi:hypothetical protein
MTAKRSALRACGPTSSIEVGFVLPPQRALEIHHAANPLLSGLPAGFHRLLSGCSARILQPVVSDEKDARNSKIQELGLKRVAVLGQIHELAKKGYLDGLISHEQLRAAKANLLSAKLDYAETRQERIKICDEAVKDARDWQKMVQDGAAARVFSRLDVLKAESDLLQSQITREQTDHDDE